ncbi:gluconate 2-dehydrogenase subunit 3 family protein [Paenibacillus sp. GCM10023248]|uniref:gluconate 2-dehydrogenase subunit 3 family protein n=1 Tax=unclassified Paenibacillus TaxID=185978 RepID=UPI002379A2D3|nr:gluconate 2-dehydrogenase subunit 3 family protein [Paenibacillus sp. MAHUQ-63]MDD9270530.1 gluconate 2-dehydrogenase subunit 3 family protein [Paenibacillus sp. MAHUQ-63]
MTQIGHYPSFDVMDEQDAWDDHTQSIVTSRLNSEITFHFLTEPETKLLRRICSILVNDQRADVLDYILVHIDQTLHQSPGESQRKVGVPHASELVRSGLGAIEQGARLTYDAAYTELDTQEQIQYLQSISASMAEPQHIWSPIPQKELFKKLMNLTIESYCSHPNVWSEIGYAGPAYPRGYVRTEIGQLDPWEAKPQR